MKNPITIVGVNLPSKYNDLPVSKVNKLIGTKATLDVSLECKITNIRYDSFAERWTATVETDTFSVKE